MRSEFNNYKVYIFTGHFGSGKTEVAANFAIGLSGYAEKGVNICTKQQLD
jgi:predicted ATPase